MACAASALVWANSPWSASYFALWHVPVGISIGSLQLTLDLHHWINDGLMAVFFFVVGLEIKRELLSGELSDRRSAALPIAAAFGGMLLPAAIYAALNAGGAGARGWGVPMATDIAFSLGVLALVGTRAPLPLRVFLAAFAIVDDIGAVLVIAVFYTTGVQGAYLVAGAAVLAAMLVANVAGVRSPWLYGALAGALWLAFLQSGVHATVAGVLAAMAIPARARIDGRQFTAWSRDLLDAFEREADRPDHALAEERGSMLQALETAIDHAQSPLQQLEHALGYVTAFVIVPLFALANAGVSISGNALDGLRSPIGVGIVLGLLLGKQIGITGFAWLAVRMGVAALPAGVTWRHIWGASLLGGIGFTMSLFIASLAFKGATLDVAKLAILAASLAAGVLGYGALRREA